MTNTVCMIKYILICSTCDSDVSSFIIEGQVNSHVVKSVIVSQIHSLVVGMLTPAPVQQLGRGERADPGVSQLTLPNSDSIA